MITITMGQVIDFRNNEDFFMEANLPLKGAYKINKIRKALDKEAETYSSKFQEIIETYGKKDEDGKIMFSESGEQILIQEDKLEECNKAIEELQGIEIEVDNYNLTIDDLGENLECTPEELDALMPFLS